MDKSSLIKKEMEELAYRYECQKKLLAEIESKPRKSLAQLEMEAMLVNKGTDPKIAEELASSMMGIVAKQTQDVDMTTSSFQNPPLQIPMPLSFQLPIPSYKPPDLKSEASIHPSDSASQISSSCSSSSRCKTKILQSTHATFTILPETERFKCFCLENNAPIKRNSIKGHVENTSETNAHHKVMKALFEHDNKQQRKAFMKSRGWIENGDDQFKDVAGNQVKFHQ